MAHLLRVHDSRAQRLPETSMPNEGLEEARHLEQWIVQHPEVIDGGLKIVTTQFNRWASTEGGSAREALDILALSSSGQTVVLELKRGGDRKVHLQAITYGALVAGFDRQMLAEAHAQWLRKRGTDVTVEEALAQLTDHLESEWDDDILKLPRLVLVAEEFPDQVLTTVQWLSSTVASDLDIECHEYHLFKDSDGTLVTFQKRFPVDNLEGRTLRPTAGVDTGEVRAKIANRERRARSVRVISENEGIPIGGNIALDLNTLVKPDVAVEVNAWLDADPLRRDVTWVPDGVRPLIWAANEDPTKRWTPTSLRDEIFRRAGVSTTGFSAADAWTFDGENFYSIAERILASRADSEALEGR